MPDVLIAHVRTVILLMPTILSESSHKEFIPDVRQMHVASPREEHTLQTIPILAAHLRRLSP
jgi:hypothetical protein